MSAIDDIGKVLQDFLVPELRAVHVRLDAIEETMDVRFGAIEEKVNIRFDSIEEKVNMRFDAVSNRFDSLNSRFSAVEEIASARHNELVRIEGLKSSLELDKRVERLESRQPQHPS